MKPISAIIFSILSILSLLSELGFSQNYEGLVGKYKVSMSIDISDDDNVSGYYFYNSQLKDIQFEGIITNGSIELHKKYSQKRDKIESFQLSAIGDSIIGKWTNKGNSLPVKLKLSDKEFDRVKRDKLEFVRDSVQKFGDKEVVWLSEKYSKISHFRLGNGFSTKQRVFFNPKLDSMHYIYAIDYLNCEDLYLSVDIELVSERFVCFTDNFSVYCGGAHPNHGLHSYNFDINKLESIENLANIYPELDFYKLIKNKYQDDPNLESECNYFTSGIKESYWEYPNWVLTKQGLKITPDFPHALTPCEIPFILTYEDIKMD